MATPQDFLNSDYHYAVVGASANHDKYGYKVFRDLHEAGLTVTPINPKLTELDGVPAAATVEMIEPRPDVIVFVVPPAIGLEVLEQAAAAAFKKFWFQPGAESPEITEKVGELGVDAMTDGSCIMVDRRMLGIGKNLQSEVPKSDL